MPTLSSDHPSAGIAHRLAGYVRRPEFVTDLFQILKTVLAATLAWWFSGAVLDSQMPFLAPWTALLVPGECLRRGRFVEDRRVLLVHVTAQPMGRRGPALTEECEGR